MKRFTSAVRKYVNEQFGDPEAFEKLYMGEKHECIPDDLMGDDLLLDIKEKFHSIFHPLREQLEKERLAEKPIYIFVDPSYEDTTAAIMTHEADEVLFILYRKAWHLSWATEKEMEEELNEIYERIKERLTKGMA
jgi:hypothetical protein